MVRFVRKTPVVDGSGLKNTLESRLAQFIDQRLGDYVQGPPCPGDLGRRPLGNGMSFYEAADTSAFSAT